jgi:hypothetical protein
LANLALYSHTEYDREAYSKNLELILQQSFDEVFQKGMDILEQVKKEDEKLDAVMKKYKVELDEIARTVGYEKELSRHRNLLLIDRLANGVFLDYPKAKKTKLKDVIAFLIVDQKRSYLSDKDRKKRMEKMRINAKK